MEAILRPITQKLPKLKPVEKVLSRRGNPKGQVNQTLFNTFMTAHLLPILTMGSAGNGPNGQLIPAYINPLICAFRLVLGDHIIGQSSTYIMKLEQRYQDEAQAGTKRDYLRALAADPHSKALFGEFALRFLLSFERYSRRKSWLIHIVNTSLEENSLTGDFDRTLPDFTVVHFAHFMTSLALESKNSPKPNQLLSRMLLRRFSHEHLPRFQKIFKAIQRNYAEVTLYAFQ